MHYLPPLKSILSPFSPRMVTWDKERSWRSCPPSPLTNTQGAGRGRKKNIIKVSFHWDEEEKCPFTVPFGSWSWCWNPRANEDRWIHPYCWGLDTNEYYLMVKGCHGAHWLISRVRRRLTPPAHQLLIIEPKSVGKQSQKDEATVGSQLTFTTRNKGKNSSRWILCTSHQEEMCCSRARYPQGGPVRVEVTNPWLWLWELSKGMLLSQKICCSFSARGSTPLSFLTRDLSTAPLYNSLPCEHMKFYSELSLKHSEVSISPWLSSLPLQGNLPTSISSIIYSKHEIFFPMWLHSLGKTNKQPHTTSSLLQKFSTLLENKPKKQIYKSDPWERRTALKISFPSVWRSAGNDEEIALSYIHTFVRAHTDTAGRHWQLCRVRLISKRWKSSWWKA